MNTTLPSGSGIPNHLAWAIIATVIATCLCCPLGLLGIVAIVYAAKVNTLLNQGDLEGARRASETAKTWCWVATGLAILGLVLYIVSSVTGFGAQYLDTLQHMKR